MLTVGSRLGMLMVRESKGAGRCDAEGRLAESHISCAATIVPGWTEEEGEWTRWLGQRGDP